MGECNCSYNPLSGVLYASWREGVNEYIYHAKPGYCNPFNCNNSACKAKLCANARRGFCTQFGVKCPKLGGKVVCYNECPGGGGEPVDPNSDCDYLGFFKVFCVGGKSVVKGSDLIAKYLPFFMLAFGGVAVLLLLKR